MPVGESAQALKARCTSKQFIHRAIGQSSSGGNVKPVERKKKKGVGGARRDWLKQTEHQRDLHHQHNRRGKKRVEVKNIRKLTPQNHQHGQRRSDWIVALSRSHPPVRTNAASGRRRTLQAGLRRPGHAAVEPAPQAKIADDIERTGPQPSQQHALRIATHK